MERIIEIALENAAASAGMAILVLAASLVCRRPALIHALWLIVLLKLVTPPVFLWPVARPAVLEEGAREARPLLLTSVPSTPAPRAGRETRSPAQAPASGPAHRINWKLAILPFWLL